MEWNLGRGNFIPQGPQIDWKSLNFPFSFFFHGEGWGEIPQPFYFNLKWRKKKERKCIKWKQVIMYHWEWAAMFLMAFAVQPLGCAESYKISFILSPQWGFHQVGRPFWIFLAPKVVGHPMGRDVSHIEVNWSRVLKDTCMTFYWESLSSVVTPITWYRQSNDLQSKGL